MKLPTQQEKQWSLDVPSPTLRQSNAVDKAARNFASATEKIYMHYLDRQNAANENEARSELNQLVQEEQFKIQSYQNSDEAIRGTEMYRLDSDSKLRKKTLDQLRDKYGLSNDSYFKLQGEVNREYDGLYNSSMKSTMGFINNYSLASFKRFNITEQDKAVGKILTGEDATDVISEYSSRNFRFQNDNFKGAHKRAMANEVANNTRAGLINIIKNMGDQGKETEAAILLQNILTADRETNPSLVHLQQYLDKTTITTLQRDLAGNAKISAENDAKEVRQTLDTVGKDPNSQSRLQITIDNNVRLRNSWKKTFLVPNKYKNKVQNDVLSAAAMNAVIGLSLDPTDESPALTKEDLDSVEFAVKNNLLIKDLTNSQKNLIAAQAKNMKQAIAAENSELVKYDSYTVVSNLPEFENASDAKIREGIKERGLPMAVMSKEALIDAFSSEDKLNAAVEQQLAKGQIQEFKMQAANANMILPASSIFTARIDDALAGNKQVLTTRDFPVLTPAQEREHMVKLFQKDASVKTWKKHVEPKLVKNMNSTAKKLSEETSKGVYKYPMYGNMYKDLMRSRHYYYMKYENLAAEDATARATKDVNGFLEDTYQFISNDVGFIIKNKKDTSIITKIGFFSDTTKHDDYIRKINYLRTDMVRSPEKYFHIPKGWVNDYRKIKFEPGINYGEDLSPRMLIDGKYVKPMQKKEEGEQLKFFRGTREYIENLEIKR